MQERCQSTRVAEKQETMPVQERHQSRGKRETKTMPGQESQQGRRNPGVDQLPQAGTERRLKRRYDSKRTGANRGTHGEIAE